MIDINRFEGDLSSLWKLQNLPPIHHLTWDWWWWLVMLDDDEGNPAGKQLMVLWSTKDNPLVEVNGYPWQPKGRPGFDENGAIAMDGMVAAWWYDGKELIEPLVLEESRILVLAEDHPGWPHAKGGIVASNTKNEYSMGLSPDEDRFWVRLETEHGDFDLNMTPWNKAMSSLKVAQAEYGMGMGYGISRLHGAKCAGEIDGKPVSGTAYFQKVCVQAPSPPWYWGMLHFDDGSYIDWFVPHFAATITARDSRPWKKRDISHISLSEGGLFHDVSRGRTERFSQVNVEKTCNEKGLPIFHVHMWNGVTEIRIEASAVTRAHWTFDQPTVGGLRSHLTYNEYPLVVNRIEIDDEQGIRTRKDWTTIRGNAEHSWGILL
tara:strand:+ start:626 stop:1753 length:1128 start_codon:yes stop_codon:yes gene_type:complete